MRKILFTLMVLMSFSLGAFSQEYYRESHIRWEDWTYTDSIKTVLLHRVGYEMSPPVIVLNSDEQLMLSFDELGRSSREFRVRFIHCDTAWKPSQIETFRYMEGYYEDFIRDFAYSYNTIQSYTHYNYVFPNNNIKLTLSGNYLLVVEPDKEGADPVLTMRFWIADPCLTIEATASRAAALDDRDTHQEVDFRILTGRTEIIDPYRNLKVVIRQNNRSDNAITTLKPLVVKGTELNYNHDLGNTFEGGNEFRAFDTKSIKYTTEFVERIDAGREGVYEFILKTDQKRPFKVYITEEDLNGRCLVNTVDGRDPAVEADYVKVHFRLPQLPFFTDGNVYIYGSLTNWRLDKGSMMTYNGSKKAYEKTLLLKQGYYNYQYLFLEARAAAATTERIEGNHYETENEYDIKVYYRPPSSDYDQLLGWKVISSRAK